MAKRIHAIAAYCPRIELGQRADLKEICKLIASKNTLSEGEVMHALKEFRDIVIYLSQVGRPASIEGLGTYTPSISLSGDYRVRHRVDRRIPGELNKVEGFSGIVRNKDMAGKTVDELVVRWNEEHPEDLITD